MAGTSDTHDSRGFTILARAGDTTQLARLRVYLGQPCPACGSGRLTYFVGPGDFAASIACTEARCGRQWDIVRSESQHFGA